MAAVGVMGLLQVRGGLVQAGGAVDGAAPVAAQAAADLDEERRRLRVDHLDELVDGHAHVLALRHERTCLSQRSQASRTFVAISGSIG